MISVPRTFVVIVSTGGLDDLADAHGRREVHDLVDLTDGVAHHRPVHDGIYDQVEAGVLSDSGQIVQATGGQVVHDEDRFPGIQHTLDEVRADEAGPVGDQD